MRAVILAGGFGTRLRPLTYTRPKQMLPIVNRPLIERMVGALAQHGVDDVVLSMGYQPDAIIDAYPDGRCPVGEAGDLGGSGDIRHVRLTYAVEPQPLDTAGAIRFAAEECGIDDRFLVLNGDVLTDLDLSAFMAFHDKSGGEATIHLHPVDDPSRFGVVPTDDAGRVLEFVEKPPPGEAPTNLINAGTYMLEPSVLDRIQPGVPTSIERATFPAMVEDGTLYACDGSTYWIDVGTPQHYVQAQLDLLDGVWDGPVEGISGDASVDPSALVKRSVLGAGVAIEAGARVERTILLPGTRIGADSVIEDSVAGEGVTVGPGAMLTGFTVIGDGKTVEAGARLDGIRE